MNNLVAQGLSKCYPIAGGEQLQILQDVTFTVEPSESHAILGPSGSGKSTLLAILGSLDLPTSGSLSVAGVDPSTLSEQELAQHRADRIGFVFQEHHLMPQCSVLENVLVPFLVDGTAGQQDIDLAKSLLDRVGLSQRLNHRPGQLSGGERQRTAIARALIRDPLLLLADEPTGNLDATTAAVVGELLLELQQEQQKMLVVVTHSRELAGRMQRRWQLDQGVLQPAD